MDFYCFVERFIMNVICRIEVGEEMAFLVIYTVLLCFVVQ